MNCYEIFRLTEYETHFGSINTHGPDLAVGDDTWEGQFYAQPDSD